MAQSGEHRRKTASLYIVGAGVVGSALLQQISSYQKCSSNSTRLQVCAVANSKHMYLFSPPSSDAKRTSSWRMTQRAPLDLVALTSSRAEGNCIVVDCTSSADVSAMYESWLSDGFHVVTANKKANSGSLEYYDALRSAEIVGDVRFMYETNVGAGLPIVSSVKDMVKTGDEVVKIDGVFSGSLSYIFNEFDGSEPFSVVVRRAKENGFTEPDCREDLNGMDVARKVVILAREIGARVTLENVHVCSLVPTTLAGKDVSPGEFLERLSIVDADFAKRASEAKRNDQVLRYGGLIQRTGDDEFVCDVALRGYPKDHAFGRLKDSDNIVSFWSRRYSDQPMIVQGAGAGADVTAAGVLGDILRVAD